MLEQSDVHDFAKEALMAFMIWLAGRLGHRVQKAVKDLNCLFDRMRKLEKRLGVDSDGCEKSGDCARDDEAG